MNDENIFVDESGLRQRLREAGAAPGDDLAAALAAEGGDLVCELAACDRGFPTLQLVRLGERAGVTVGPATNPSIETLIIRTTFRMRFSFLGVSRVLLL